MLSTPVSPDLAAALTLETAAVAFYESYARNIHQRSGSVLRSWDSLSQLERHEWRASAHRLALESLS